MARYTTELYKLVNGGVDIGLNDYPIFDENYRKTLNEKIINHYYFEEIGQETPFKFRHFFRTAMHEIMPFYNQLYKSALVEIDNTNSVDWQEEYSGTTELEKNIKTDNTTVSTGETNSETDLLSNSESTSASTRNQQGETQVDDSSQASDTPNGLLNPNDVNNNLYISQASESQSKTTNELDYTDTGNSADETTSKSTTENTSSSEIIGNQEQIETADNTNNYIRKVYGDQVNILQSEKLMKLRESFLNIDLMIIENQKLSECFMKIY